jgi:hypothetical protein
LANRQNRFTQTIVNSELDHRFGNGTGGPFSQITQWDKPGAITAFQPILSTLALPWPTQTQHPPFPGVTGFADRLFILWSGQRFSIVVEAQARQWQQTQASCRQPGGVLPHLNGVEFIHHAIFV